MMTPPLLQLFRHAILRQLAAALPAHLTADTLQLGLQAGGFDSDEISRLLPGELLYLTERAYISLSYHPLNAATARYRLSAAGRDHLQQEGLI
jgi:hypothetical protein